jgi:peptidoglycan/xylan/chitin deacetylase (PgdA/CDA1 family)
MIPWMRSGATVAAGAAAAGAAWALPAVAPLVPPVAGPHANPTRLATHGAVALTFDDGPHPQGTPAVLAVLAAAGARATFFMLGEQVLRAPALAAEVVAAGHEVAIHGHRHRNLLRLAPAALARDLDRARAVISEATDTAPALHRAPYGIYSWAALHAVRARGWTPVLWSRWGHDWRRGRTPAAIAAELTAGLRGGEILLLHDADDYSARGSWRRTAAALPRVLEAVAAAGLQCAPVQPSGR